MENTLRLPDNDKTYVIFTRYLYSKEEVKHSLFISILDRKEDESLFWGYELYYSGFKSETFEFLLLIYEEIYKNSNHLLLDMYLNDLYKKWKDDNSNDLCVGNIIKNILMRPYDPQPFMEKYMGVKCKYVTTEKTSQKYLLVFDLNTDSIEKYKNIEINSNNELPRFVLKNACKYSVHREYGHLFMDNVELQHEYKNEWLYYAHGSPVWRERIMKFGGLINHDRRCVDFEDEDLFEQFHNIYNYEPDEQPLEIQEKCIGKCVEKQLSIKDFAEKYHVNLLEDHVSDVCSQCK